MLFRQSELQKSKQPFTEWPADEPPPGRSLLLLVLSFFVGLFVSQFIAVLFCMLVWGIGFQETQLIAGNLQHPNARAILFSLQFFSALGGFIVGPLYYLYRFEHRSLSALINKRGAAIIPLLLAVLLTVSFMMVNSILIEWNANITLPETFKTIESWAKAQEVYLQKLTDFLTTFPSGLDFLLAFAIIAILPAFGEELLFRGLMQPLMQRLLKNAHVAIWLTAFIFSAFHMQFYGLVPRLLLGALFGYLYYWSGNLLMPILGHFINNGVSLLMRYLYQLEYTQFDGSEPQALSGSWIAVFLLLGVVGAVGFKSYFSKDSEEEAA